MTAMEELILGVGLVILAVALVSIGLVVEDLKERVALLERRFDE